VTDDETVFEQAGQDPAHHSAPQTPEASLIAKADAQVLQQALASLAPLYREIIVLREIDGLSYQEISKVLSVPVGTVMSRLSRARSLLIDRVGRAMTAEKGAA